MTGKSNSLNSTYQPILSRAPDAVPPCNDVTQVSCSPGATFPVNNALLSIVLANSLGFNPPGHIANSLGINSPLPIGNSLGLNSPIPTNLGLNSSIPTNMTHQYDGNLSHLMNNMTQRSIPNASEVNKVKKAMELIIALGL